MDIKKEITFGEEEIKEFKELYGTDNKEEALEKWAKEMGYMNDIYTVSVEENKLIIIEIP